MGNKKQRNKQKEQEVVLTVFTNNMRDESAYQLLQLFYKGSLENSIGMMRALNNATGEEELVLVGIEKNEDGGLDTYPLASILTPDKVPNYFSPNGLGGWFQPGQEAEAEPMDLENAESVFLPAVS